MTYKMRRALKKVRKSAVHPQMLHRDDLGYMSSENFTSGLENCSKRRYLDSRSTSAVTQITISTFQCLVCNAYYAYTYQS
jgi:hypothetical protein